ncbi:MAG: 4Fe-4S dicluster domain-containing protein [Conexivisphaerales archaeon]
MNPIKSDPGLVDDVKALGAINIDACFNCGTCTAVCPLSSGSSSFPRRMITYAQIGVKEKILESPDLWLCNYCGECTKSCPRQADPAETMMALRRYATIEYSPPGVSFISKMIYKSKAFALSFLIILSIIPLILMLSLHGSINSTSIMLFSFFPEHYIDIIGVTLGIIIFGIMLFGLAKMYFMTRKGVTKSNTGPVRILKWIVEFFQTIFKEVLAQERLDQCEMKGWRQRLSSEWFIHMTIFWGFTGLLVTTVLGFLLPTAISVPLANGIYIPITEPIRLLGTLSGLFLIYGASMVIINRVNKSRVYSSYSYFTDWALLIFLLLAGLTGYLLEMAYYLNSPLITYALLTVHLTVVFDLFAVAPFTKFAHAFYRPLAIWLSRSHNYI